ncbi:hypothetical protein GH740_07500 [Microbacterium sp. SYP-A9085]|uniref:hypothetical protein n=1 Tax=Microbacterium sp. SYP-A9085 TaxID=2664454 RepID=UPI00129A41EF|nr:hypothetical protein [Microbacterium sp. SYP-A9085]MRH29160.1 hypothetical protein [Microbacterium sp. SYP-A9085]
MFILCFLLFVAGFACFGYAPFVDGWQSAIFVLGILLCATSIGIPMHHSRHEHKSGELP